MSPILLARTRVNQSMAERAASSQGKLQTSLMYEMKLSTQLMVDAVKKEGAMVLTTGMPACVVKRMFDWGTRCGRASPPFPWQSPRLTARRCAVPATASSSSA